MKNSFLTFFILTYSIAFSQYSDYYKVNSNSDINVNANVNVNTNIKHNVSGVIYQHSTQTIETIDYGALALANAQKEQNQIELQKIADENQKKMLAEIIADPIKAYDYGEWQGFNSRDKKILDKNAIQKYEDMTGLKSFGLFYVFPKYFFDMLSWTNWQNTSKEGVTTEIFLSVPVYNKENLKYDFEERFENDTILAAGKEVDAVDDMGKVKKTFCHKKELNLATVFCAKGYKSTVIWEDKFEYGITENYNVFNSNIGNGIVMTVKVRYHGDKDEITFEQLEGRRYYLKPLIEKIISTAKLQDIVLIKK